MGEPLRLRTLIRGPGLFQPSGRFHHRRLTSGQPLVLERQPSNPVDPSAVILRTLMGQPVGYVQRPKSVIVAALMDQGTMLLARVVREADVRGLVWYKVAEALIWSEGRAETQASTSNANPCLELFEDIDS